MDILKKAVNQAVTLLNSCGARYHIVEADGTIHGQPVEPEKKRTRKRDPNAISYRDILKEKVAPMQVGDVVVIATRGTDTTARVQSHVAAFCCKTFGNGCCMTTINDGAVEVLRIK